MTRRATRVPAATTDPLGRVLGRLRVLRRPHRPWNSRSRRVSRGHAVQGRAAQSRRHRSPRSTAASRGAARAARDDVADRFALLHPRQGRHGAPARGDRPQGARSGSSPTASAPPTSRWSTGATRTTGCAMLKMGIRGSTRSARRWPREASAFGIFGLTFRRLARQGGGVRPAAAVRRLDELRSALGLVEHRVRPADREPADGPSGRTTCWPTSDNAGIYRLRLAADGETIQWWSRGLTAACTSPPRSPTSPGRCRCGRSCSSRWWPRAALTGPPLAPSRTAAPARPPPAAPARTGSSCPRWRRRAPATTTRAEEEHLRLSKPAAAQRQAPERAGGEEAA